MSSISSSYQPSRRTSSVPKRAPRPTLESNSLTVSSHSSGEEGLESSSLNVPSHSSGAKGKVAAALEVLNSSDTIQDTDLEQVRKLLRDATALLTPRVESSLPRSPAPPPRSPRRTKSNSFSEYVSHAVSGMLSFFINSHVSCREPMEPLSDHVVLLGNVAVVEHMMGPLRAQHVAECLVCG